MQHVDFSTITWLPTPLAPFSRYSDEPIGGWFCETSDKLISGHGWHAATLAAYPILTLSPLVPESFLT